MLDIRRIRADKEGVQKALDKRNGHYDLDAVIKVDEDRRKLIAEVEELKARQNAASKEIPELKKAGKETDTVFKELKELSDKIKDLDVGAKELDEKLRNMLLEIPNAPNADVVIGDSDEDNVEVRKFKEPTKFDFEPKAHWDLGVDLDILDFERASKITGARFTLFKGLGARLERALINFMVDTHTEEHGYTEMLTPFMVNRNSMIGTGQLPKFENDMFHLPVKDYFMVPTAEVPLTNLHRDEILATTDLPIKYTGYTPCFRQEAGSAGRDTRGVIRNHQFDKVELVKLVDPKTSYDELEKLTNDAEEILKKLDIPYRVVMLSTGDLGFSSAKTYDIEVWMPSYDRYVEISSCSNFEDFQARRANLRFRNEEGKTEFVHTLNGSGLAVGRTLAAVLENYQEADGTIRVPEVLKPYMRNLDQIK